MIQSLTLLARQWVKIIKLLFPVGLLVLVLLIWMIIGIRIISIISMTVCSWISRKLVLGIYIMLSQTATTSQSNTIATSSSSSDDVRGGRVQQQQQSVHLSYSRHFWRIPFGRARNCPTLLLRAQEYLQSGRRQYHDKNNKKWDSFIIH